MMPAPAAAAPDRTPTPSARELWETYPLQQDPAATAEPARTAAGGSARPASARPASAHTSAPDGGGTPLVLVASAALAALAGALVLRRRRVSRPPDAPGALAIPLLAAAATTAAMPGQRREAPRLTTLAGTGDGGRDDDDVDAVSPPDPAQRWTAELEWHPEDGEPRFHVIARPSGGGPETRIASSKPLEWPPPDAVAVQRLRRTVAHMEAAMRRVGWTPLPPGAAWYSKRFAWTPVAEPVREAVRARDPEPAHEAVRARDPEPPASAAMRLFEPQPAWPPGTEDLWRCEIRWRAGYVNSRFTLVARRPGRRRTTTISSSQTFKWLIMEDPDPPSPEFRGAVEHLDEQIRAAGWEPAGRGRHWWDLRYVWRGDGPPPLELDPEPASMRDARGEDDEP